ncbi:MAG: S8 family serine peptidase [Armatimonadetes bacterium]|nr:S8 family serine peptidase [Armatimonadota bacterium]
MKRTITLLVTSFIAILTFASLALGGTIYLKSGTVETSSIRAASALTAEHMPGAGYYLVALRGLVTDEDKQALASCGAEIVEYIPDSAFVVHIEHARVASIKALGCVEWVGPFKAEYKSRDGFAAGRAQYVVTLFPGRNADHVLARLSAPRLGGGPDSSGKALRVLADQSQLVELAKSSAVAWIEPYVQPKLCNNAAGIISGIPDVRDNLGLYGAGQVVGVADAGLDSGDVSTISADFSGRVNKTYALRRPNAWSDLNGHGTHTTGSFLGSGVLSGSNPALHSYNNSFAGVAPEASLVFQSIGDDGQYVFPPLHLTELFQPAYDDGARVHSNSWGSAVNGQYTVYSNEVDQFVWDHKDFTLVFAVGNEAQDVNQDGVVEKDCLYAPATAKNCISVGATENNRTSGGYQMGYGIAWPSSYPSSPIKYDLVSNDPNGMAAFSGRGPTDDGRVKPDICAPGTNIISCRTHATNSSAGWGTYNSDYIYWGGTSMSTPQVAGAATLVREYFQKEKGINPSAALVKATMINGAVDITPGQYGYGQFQEVFPAPDSSQGWGRMNVKQSLAPDPPIVNEFTDSPVGLSTGGYRDFQYTVVDASTPFKATLAWTDYPGAVHAANELVNDLDLAITAPSGTVYPTITKRDHVNNVEQVKIANPEVGTYTVRVSGYNVPMGPQDYALAVSGGMPNTYISGTVNTTLGAGVSGALVMMVYPGGIKRVTTNQSGSYLTHIEPGTYSVQVSKPGWTFTPRGWPVTITNAPVENVNFVGVGSRGSLSGKITSAVGGVVSHIVESSHPYLNNQDQTWVITGHDGASRIRVHFAETDLMNDGDTIYVLDGNGKTVNTFTGKGEDIWSAWVTGCVIKIRLVANDYGNIGYGFYADGYETDLIQQGGLQDATLTLSPGGYQAISGADGTYSLASVPPGTYSVTPSKTYWKFQPDAKTIEVPAGGAASGVDFTAFPPGSITGEALVSASEAHAVDIESPHPYPDSYDNTWDITGPAEASRIRLHFSQLSTEPAWDFVYIMDGQNNLVEIYTADYTDLWTPWVNGNIARIELTSDTGNTAYGFVCDKYEVEMVGAPLGGATVELSPDNRSTMTSSQGVFEFPEVDMGFHSITPKLTNWTFDPPSAQVSISPGMLEHTIFYVKLGVLTKTSAARCLPDGLQVTLQGLKVSAVFNGYFYIEDPDRIGGLRVVSSTTVHEGNTVDVTGTLGTVDGERRIVANTVSVR